MQELEIIQRLLHPNDRREHHLRYHIWKCLANHLGASIFTLKGPYTFCQSWSENIIMLWEDAQKIFCNICVKQDFLRLWLSKEGTLNLANLETILSHDFDWRLFLDDEQFRNSVYKYLVTFNRKDHYEQFKCHLPMSNLRMLLPVFN